MPKRNLNNKKDHQFLTILNKIFLVSIVLILLTGCDQNYGCITANQSTMLAQAPPIITQTNAIINANGNYQTNANTPIYNQWVNTGLKLKAGDSYEISLNGNITLCNTAASPDVNLTLSQQLNEQVDAQITGQSEKESISKPTYIGRCYYVDAGNPCGVDTGITVKSGGHLTITLGDVGQPGCQPSSSHCSKDQPGCSDGLHCISPLVPDTIYPDTSGCLTQTINYSTYSSLPTPPLTNQWVVSLPFTGINYIANTTPPTYYTPRTYTTTYTSNNTPTNISAKDYVNFSIGGLYGYNINTFYFNSSNTGQGLVTTATYGGGPITFSANGTQYGCNPQSGVATPKPGTPLFTGSLSSIKYATTLKAVDGNTTYDMTQIDIPSLNLESSGNLFINFTYPSNYGGNTPVYLFDKTTNPNDIIYSPIANNWQYNYGGQSVYIYYNDCEYYSGYRTEIAFTAVGQSPNGTTTSYTDANGNPYSVYTTNTGNIIKEDIVDTPYGGNGVVTDTYNLETPGTLWLRVFDDNTTVDGITGDGNYPDNTGAYTAKITVEEPPAAKPGPVSCCVMSIICAMQDTITTAMNTSFTSFSGNVSFLAFIHSLLTLFMIIWGIMIIFGLSQITQKTFITNVIKMSIVIALTRPDSFSFFYNYFISLFMGGATYLVSIFSVDSVSASTCSGLCTPGCSAQNPFMFVDDFISFIFNTNTIIRMLALALTGIGLIFIALIIYGLYKYFLAMLKVMIAYIYALVILGFLFYIGPLFISCVLFKPTFNFFNNWKNMILRYTIEPTLLLVGITVINQVITILLWGSLQYSICFKCTLPIYLTIVPLPGEPPLFCIPWFFPWGYDPLTNGIWMFLFAFISIVVMFVMSVRLLEQYTNMATLFASTISGSMVSGSPLSPQMALGSFVKNTGGNISSSVKALRKSSIIPDIGSKAVGKQLSKAGNALKQGAKKVADKAGNAAKRAGNSIANSKIGRGAVSLANSKVGGAVKTAAKYTSKAAAIAMSPGGALYAKATGQKFGMKEALTKYNPVAMAVRGGAKIASKLGDSPKDGAKSGSKLGASGKGLVNWVMGSDSPYKKK